MATSLKGSLREYSLLKILTDLHRKRATGTLAISTPNVTKKVYLVKGDAIFAASSYEDDRLGEMLLKAGKITFEQYDKSVEILKRTKKRLGAILVELGYLTPKDLFWGVKYQVKEIIYSLFQLEDAECEFIEGDVPTDEVITLKMSMGNLIHEGAKRIDNWTRIRREMPKTGIVLTLSKDPLSLFQDVELSPYDKKMLTIIDGKKTIKEVIDSSWMNSFEAMKTIYVLWSIGILEEKTAEEDELKEEAGKTVSLDDLLQPFAEEEDALIKRVEEIYPNLDRFKLNELLEVGEDEDVEAINKNYYRLAREFHPDRYFNTSDAALKDKLTAVFDALTAAFTILKDGHKRKEYSDSPGKQTGEMMAEKMHMEEIQIEAAQEEKIQEAEETLLKAIKLEPLNGEHYANLGSLYLKAGLHKRASGQFEKALEFDPGNVKAQKGLKQAKESE
ncbi:MAG: DUF4388 domain-containing protein [Nitrospirae bacterium]|nr:DUF4388 domain-containing protein [Nitrospirota bacterium]